MYSFIGRKKELQALEALYRKPGFQMTILYGRRRIGKSTLLQKFAEHKKVIFYTAIRSSLYRNLELLSQRVLEVLAPESLGMVFQNLEQLFSFLAKKCQKERIVFILDEFPYMAEEYPSLLSILQKAIDTEWQQGQMYLILCGSSLSFMEEKVLSEKSPLFGRRTSQLKLGPFSYLEAADFISDCSFEEKAICYGVTGGVAKYLSLWDKDRSLDQNITDLFFQKSGYLFEEPANLLTQEFRNISSYSAIIEAVASGKTRPAEIADAAHLDSSATSHALRNLVATEIVQKNQPITDEKNRKKIRYTLADTMFQFWYRFVPAALDAIELGRGAAYYQTIVRPQLSDYMGSIYEEMCRTYTLLAGLDGKLACFVTRTGKWWGTDPQKKEETDIDVVGLDPVHKQAVLGECRFKMEPVDKKVYESLKERNGLIDRHYQTVQYLFFARSGFSSWLQEQAAKEPLKLIDLQELYEGVKM